MRADWGLSSSFWRNAPFSFSALASTFSSVPYFSRSFRAVFSPTPGIPGRLSELSPINPLRSTMRSGSRPYCSMRTALSYSTVSLMPFLVIRTWVCSFISCRASRSPVTSSASIPAAFALRENVPRISSASYLSHSHTVMPISLSSLLSMGNWVRRSSGVGLLPALYSSYCSWRKVGPCISKATSI